MSRYTEYWQSMVKNLEGQNAVDVIRQTPRIIERIVSEAPTKVFHESPAPGKWTGCEIIGHYIDVDWMLGYRARVALAEKVPTFGEVDQDLWVTSQRWNAHHPAELVALFDKLRAASLPFWVDLNDDELARSGHHTGADTDITIGQMREFLAGHDLHHIRHLEQTLAAATTQA